MLTRRAFLAGLAGSVLAFPHLVRAARRTGLKLGLVTDPQYADVAAAGSRFYRQSPGKLRAAIGTFNGLDLDFCLNLGDTIDRQWESYTTILEPLKGSRHKFYHVLGNHDFEVADGFKARVPGRLGMKRRWRAVDQGEFCCVLLDTNDVSTYAHPRGAKELGAAEAELERLKGTGAANAQPWNGGVGEEQLRWFEKTCAKAARRGRKVLVFAHHPIYPAEAHSAWNCEALVGSVLRHRNVVAWFNGHNHAGNFGTCEGVPFVTLKGMVETPDTNAYAVVELIGERLVLTGYGREISREVRLRA